MKTAPTPLRQDNIRLRHIYDSEDYQIARTQTPEQAEHIVKCVNIHDELVAFVKKFAEHGFYDARKLLEKLEVVK